LCFAYIALANQALKSPNSHDQIQWPIRKNDFSPGYPLSLLFLAITAAIATQVRIKSHCIMGIGCLGGTWSFSHAAGRVSSNDRHQHKQRSQGEAGAEHGSPLLHQPIYKPCQSNEQPAGNDTEQQCMACIDKEWRDSRNDANVCSDRKTSDQIQFVGTSCHA